MKNILLITFYIFLIFVFSLFARYGQSDNENDPNPNPPTVIPLNTLKNSDYAWEDQEIDCGDDIHMTYRIFYKKFGTSIFVVNLTKDKIEVELLQKQLEGLK